jgi:Na+-driven multidrug efflux pump
MGGAVASAVARALGAGDRERGEQLIWHALALAALGALLLLTLFRAFWGVFFALSGRQQRHS